MNCIAGTVRFLALLLLLVLAAASGFSQSAGVDKSRTGKRRMADERSVINVRDLARRERFAPVRPAGPKARTHKTIPDSPIPADAIIKFEDPSIALAPARTSETPRPLSPTTAVNFLALEDAGNVIPPDTNGAVGPNHLMVTLNTQVRISNRSGTTISTVSLNFFWASLGTLQVFDPKVLYDPFSDRWMFTAVSDADSSASAVLIGVSQTSDPTGTWNLFKYDADAGNSNWADYPSMGFNKNWIVVTVNMFAVAGSGGFAGSELYVFSKADLYAGGNGDATILTDSTSTWAPAVTHDNTLNTMHLIRTWNSGAAALRLATITGSIGSEIFTLENLAIASEAWSNIPPTNFAPQKDSNEGIDSGDARMLKVVFRNGALWCSHTVLLPPGTPNRASVQWWKLGTDATILQRGRIDDPSAAEFRAYPVLAVNKNDDVLIGYSVFSKDTFATAAYSFRSAADPANTLQSEVDLKLGEAKYFKTFGGSDNRWGDYSNTVVDPVNDVDMWTIQEFAAAPFLGSDRWGTWWGKLELPDPDFTLLISNPSVSVFPGETATFNGTLTAIDGFSSSVTLTCEEGHTGIPGTCNGETATPSPAGQAFSVTASSGSVQDFAFNIQGVGADAFATTHIQAVTLNVVDINLTDATPSAVMVVKGNTSSAISFQAVASGSYSGALTLSCDGLPAGANCHFSPSNLVTPTSGSPATISLTVSTEPTTPEFLGAVTITATSDLPVGVRTESFNLTVTSPVFSSNLGVDMSHSFGAGRINFGASATFGVLVSNSGPDAASNVALSLTFAGARLKTAAPGCAAPVGNTISCEIAMLANAGNQTLEFVFEAAVAGGILVNSSVTSNSGDPVQGNNSDSEFLKAGPRARTVRGN